MINKAKSLYAATLAAIFSVIFIASSTVVADLYPPLKGWLKVTFTHHWIGKSVLAMGIMLVLWFILSLILPRDRAYNLSRIFYALFWLALLSAVIILGFYIFEYAK